MNEAVQEVNAVVHTSKGDIKMRLFADKAPITVANFVNLAKRGYYDGLTFHRVVPSFVVQGGDPTGTGGGGSGQNLPAEFSDVPHVKGTVSMARSSDPNSADSQFYVSLGRHPHLDRKYTVFGYVVEGMENVEKITQGDKMDSLSIETQ